jgi:hypothetical protein
MPNLHEFLPVAGSRIDRQDISNPRGIEFVLEEIGFQRHSLFRL